MRVSCGGRRSASSNCALTTFSLCCILQPTKKKAKKEESEEEAAASAEEQHYSEPEAAEKDAKPAPKKRKVRPPASAGASVHDCGTSLMRTSTAPPSIDYQEGQEGGTCFGRGRGRGQGGVC